MVKGKYLGEDGSFMEIIFQNLGLEEEAEILPRENKGDKVEDLVVVNMVEIQWLLELHATSI